MTDLRIAFIPLARPTFDMQLAYEVMRAVRSQLQTAGFQLLGPTELVTDLPDAQAIAKELASEPVDLLLILQATFADSTMVIALAESIHAPIFLWAIPESPNGGRLRLNSLCGINLAGHALTLRHQDYDYAYAPPEDRVPLDQAKTLASAGNVFRRLKTARLGVIGEHPPGMDSCHLDEPQLRERLGIEVVQIDLSNVFELARQETSSHLATIRHQLDLRLHNLADLAQEPLNGSLRVYTALQKVASEERLDALAVRCWPEFFTDMGCAACGAMSMLSDGFAGHTPIPCSCEADVNGTVTQLILQWLSDTPAFGSDLVSMDFEQDVAAFWHCGLAPLSMANPTVQPHGGNHSNRHVPLVMEFPLKPGHVTLARLSQATGQLRLVLGCGEMLAAPAPFAGTSGTLRFQNPARKVFDTLMTEGLEHHLSLAYGDFYASLQALARLLNLPTLDL